MHLVLGDRYTGRKSECKISAIFFLMQIFAFFFNEFFEFIDVFKGGLNLKFAVQVDADALLDGETIEDRTTRNGRDGIATYRTRKNKNKLWANTN